MNINVSIGDLSAIDLSTPVGGEITDYDYESGEVIGTKPKTLGDIVAEKLAEKMWAAEEKSDIRRTAYRRRDEVIRELVTPAIERALTGSIRQTNSYGEPTGPEVTLRELIVKKAEELLKPADRYSREPSVTQKVIATEVNRAFAKELEDTLKAEKEKAIKAVRAAGGQVIAAVVKDVAKALD